MEKFVPEIPTQEEERASLVITSETLLEKIGEGWMVRYKTIHKKRSMTPFMNIKEGNNVVLEMYRPINIADYDLMEGDMP